MTEDRQAGQDHLASASPVQAQAPAMPVRSLTTAGQAANGWVEAMHLHASMGKQPQMAGAWSSLDLQAGRCGRSIRIATTTAPLGG